MIICYAIISIILLNASNLWGQTDKSASAELPAELEKMAFTLGEWHFDGKYPKPDGTFGTLKYRSRVNRTMGGKAFQDNFGKITAEGKMDTLGITVRTYDPKSEKWRMLWFSANLDFITQFEGEYTAGEFHFTGKGIDKGRPFLEKVAFYNIGTDSYSWKMHKSYDDGKTWIENFFMYDASRITATD